MYQNDRKFIHELAKTPGMREDFLFSGEAVYDWELEAYEMCIRDRYNATDEHL